MEIKIAVIHEGKEPRYNNDFKLKNKIIVGTIAQAKELKRIDDETYIAKVVGTNEYTVIAKMRGKFCESADCTCPFNEVVSFITVR